jgi:GNAT superfamily N-acetyltransferase
MISSNPAPIVERLAAKHVLDRFDCGKPALDDWLKRYALANDRADASRTYITRQQETAIGFYSLAAGSVLREAAPLRIGKVLANHPIPVAVLARLAVDRAAQGSGLGAALLQDALFRIVEAADVIGIRAVLVHAIDEGARAFYLRFDFQPSPFDELQLMLLMKDLRGSLRVRQS